MISVPGCISSSPAQTTILLLRSCQTTLYDRPTAPDVKQEDDEWVPAYAQSTPRIEQKSSGGRRKENNETTPAMKAGVGDVLQISTWMNSDSILGDCRTGELAVIKVGVESVLCEQLLVSPLLDDRTMVHDKDVVSVSDGRETVGNDETGPPGHQLCHCFLDAYFRSGIDTACSLIENQDGRVCQDHTRDRQQLLLAS